MEHNKQCPFAEAEFTELIFDLASIHACFFPYEVHQIYHM